MAILDAKTKTSEPAAANAEHAEAAGNVEDAKPAANSDDTRELFAGDRNARLSRLA